MDPVTLIGTAGAAANIIQVINSAVSSLNQLHSQWKDADFTFMNLAAQLGALRIALGKLQEWLESESEDSQHHQLIMDLDMSMTCCHLLVNKMDAQLLKLRQMPNGNLRSSSKVKLILGDASIERLQQMVERQTNALTLVLSACNCATISQQKAVLEESDARSVFEHVKDDSSSLFGLRDSSSFISRYTDKLSKLSIVFPFDKEVLSTGVYQRVLRGSLKERIRQQQSKDKTTKDDRPKEDWRPSRMRNEEIEDGLRRDRMVERNKFKILLTGHQSSIEVVLKSFLNVHGDCPSESECAAWRSQVITQGNPVLRQWWEACLSSGLQPKEWKFAPSDFVAAMGNSSSSFQIDQHSAVVLLFPFKDLKVREAIFSSLPQDADRDEMTRSLQTLSNALDIAYKPSRKQIADLDRSPNRVSEHNLIISDLTYNLIEVPQLFARKGQKSLKSLAFWDSATALVYGIDLIEFAAAFWPIDEQYEQAENCSRALKDLETFTRLQSLDDIPIILIFTNADAFSEAILDPHQEGLPGYSGSPDYWAAKQHIIGACVSYACSLKDNASVYSFFNDDPRSSVSRYIFSVVNDTIIRSSFA